MTCRITFAINTIEEEQTVVDRYRGSVSFFNENHIRYTLPQVDIKDEYRPELYQTAADTLRRVWDECGLVFFDRLCSFFRFAGEENITIRISQYGPWGTYDLADHSVTINRHAEMDHLKILKHEMVHLMVEPFVQSFGFDHTQKEYVVETIGTMIDALDERRTGVITP